MNESQFIEHLKDLSKQEGGQNKLAKKLGISSAHLCDILHGRRQPGEKVLTALGLVKVVSYERRL